jgi:hypothetical protein
MLLDRLDHSREDVNVPNLALSPACRARLLVQVGLFVNCLVGYGCTVSDPGGGAAGAAGTAGGVSTGSSGSGNAAGATTTAGTGGSAPLGGGGSTVGGGGTAAVGGTGTGGGNGTAGMTGSCSATYLLCEDFESTAVGSAPMGWTAHGKASVAEDQAGHGKHSLKVSPADNGERRIYHPTTMLGAQHWGRVYYRVMLPTPDAFVHSTMVTFFGKGPTVGDAEFRVVDTVKDAKTGGFANGKHQFLYNVQPQGAEFGNGSPYDYTFEDKWHCAEWHVNAAEQSYQFFYDGKEVISFTKGAGVYKDSELPDGFAEVRLGWNNYQSAPPGFTAWLDDFALDDERVGCLP